MCIYKGNKTVVIDRLQSGLSHCLVRAICCVNIIQQCGTVREKNDSESQKPISRGTFSKYSQKNRNPTGRLTSGKEAVSPRFE